MFKKPFHVKKNVNLRNSDTRKLIARIPGETADVVDKKAQVAHAKVVSYHDVPINLYLFDKTPLLFDFDEKALVYPTVYFLWKAPALFPTLVVHEPVLQYLENGADLMLQGVARGFPVPSFLKNDAIGIALLVKGKLQPVAVGAALMSSAEMQAVGFKGKGLQVLHVVKDTLWEFGPRGTAPLLDPCQVFPPEPEVTETPEATEEAPAAEEAQSDDTQLAEQVAAVSIEEEATVDVQESEEPVEDLLFRCFIAALKFRLTRKGSFPVDVGQFYSQFLLKCVPENRRLDMKKTKYKKFATFLDEVCKHPDGPILRISKKTKGVDLIAEVHWDHPSIRSFEVTDERIKDEEAPPKATKGPIITEYFAVTENLVPFFNSFAKVPKGSLLTPVDTRTLITQYVKKENLADGNMVRVDPLLGSLVKTNNDKIDWNTLMQNVQAKMTKTFVLTMPDGRELVKKITMPKLVFKVESRSGNKKVTLLNNLALFGLEAKNLCKEIQVNLATSATTQDGAVNCEGPQLVVQGNQVSYIGDLLMGEYGIDKKYITGLDLAPKKKK